MKRKKELLQQKGCPANPLAATIIGLVKTLAGQVLRSCFFDIVAPRCRHWEFFTITAQVSDLKRKPLKGKFERIL